MTASNPCPHCVPANPHSQPATGNEHAGSQRNQPINDMCFVCGFDNPASLHAQFVESDAPGEVTAIFTPRDIHCSYPGRLHGGVAAAMCDETIGRAFISDHPDQWGVTMELSVRYHKPTPLNEPLTVKGRITKVTRRTFEGQCNLYTQEGVRCVSGKAIYARLPVERIVSECSSDDGYVWDPDIRSIPDGLLEEDDA